MSTLFLRYPVAFGAKMTSYRRRCDVIIDVNTTSFYVILCHVRAGYVRNIMDLIPLPMEDYSYITLKQIKSFLLYFVVFIIDRISESKNIPVPFSICFFHL